MATKELPKMELIPLSENREGLVYLIPCVVLQVVACIVFGMRIWSGKIQKLKLNVSDCAVLVALILSIANLGVLGYSVRVGLGVRIAELIVRDPRLIAEFFKTQVIISVIWIASLFAIKLSILYTYIRIFRTPIFVKICQGFMVLQVLWFIGAFLNIMLLCRPVAFTWDKTIAGGKCGNQKISYQSAHIIIFILDFSLAVLPIPVLWKLQINLGKKIGVMVMFSIGIVIGVFDLMRLVWLDKAYSEDATYDYALLYCFTLLEAQLGVILACIPTIQPVIRKFTRSTALRSIFTRQGGTSGSTKDTVPMGLRTFGAGGSARQRQKLDSLDTESMKPLGSRGSLDGWEHTPPNEIHVRHDIEMGVSKPQHI